MMNKRAAKEEAKSEIVIFNECMLACVCFELKEAFMMFKKAAEKGHKKAKWVFNVMKGVELEWNALQEAFIKTETPLGWWFVGLCTNILSEKAFGFFKKSAEAGCSWGQAWFAHFFIHKVEFVERDDKIYVEWLEKSANQNNPEALYDLGNFFYKKVENEKALRYYCDAANLGHKESMYCLGRHEQRTNNLRQAVIWYARARAGAFFGVLDPIGHKLEMGQIPDTDQLYYSLGWGLYWYMHGTTDWESKYAYEKVFGERCLNYYCENFELQQDSIFTFLLYWNKFTGVKGPGTIIAKNGVG